MSFYPVLFEYGLMQHIDLTCDALFLIDYFGYTSRVADLSGYKGIVIRDVTHSIFSYELSDEAYEKTGDLISHLRDNTAIGYGLFEKDEICGYVWAYPHQFREEKRIYVNEIRIREDCREQGYGKELLRLVENKARDMGFPSVYLHVEADNPDAISIYRSCGYSEERIQLRKALV